MEIGLLVDGLESTEKLRAISSQIISAPLTMILDSSTLCSHPRHRQYKVVAKQVTCDLACRRAALKQNCKGKYFSSRNSLNFDDFICTRK